MGASYTTTIEPDVLDVLNRSLITADSVTLPPGQLDRALYVKVNKVLELAGGKWKRAVKAHVFTKDPRVALGIALTDGTITDTKKQLQQFFTPPDVAALVVDEADIHEGMTVLEPSAGKGALAIAARDCGGVVTCVEIDSDLTSPKPPTFFTWVTADFLTWTPELRFDRVVMNPPFADGQDVAHISRAFTFLRPQGRLVSVAPSGIVTNSTRKYRDFRAELKRVNGSFIDLPAGSFKESDTMVNTVLVVMDKR
jgi:predicted RNA methylase